MPSRDSRKRIRILAIILVAALIGIGILAVRLVLYRAADRMLDRWDAAGLPGSRPEGRGPALAGVWPPMVRWDDVVWREETAGIARCRRLEIWFDPQSVLRRSLLITRVRIDDLQIDPAQPLPSWIDPLVATFPRPRSESGDSDKPHPEAVRFECEGLRITSVRTGFQRIEGWGWTKLPGRWQATADATTDSGSGLGLRIEGAGVAGDEEVIIDASLAEQRHVRYIWRRPLDEPAGWRLTGRDDGSLLPAMLPVPAEVGSMGLTGIIDFEISGEPGTTPAAEFQIHDLSIASAGEPPWRVSGCLSVKQGVVSLEELLFLRGEARLLASGEFPWESPSGPGWWKVTGELDGEPLDLEGVIERQASLWTLRADRLHWRDARAGPVELVVSNDGWGSAGDPPVLRAAGVPISWLEDWLPFSLPGHWNGFVDGHGAFHQAPEGWRATGRAELREVSIAGLPLVEEIGAILGESRWDNAVRLDRVRMRWAVDDGQLVADSLQIDGRSARVSGLLLAVPPDSVFGMLRVAPSGDEFVGAILRLLGGDEAAIDLGIFGDASHPDLVPLDKKTRRRWVDEVRRVRDRFWR